MIIEITKITYKYINKKHMKSKIADLKNIGGPNAGMISAGKFLGHFVKAPYVHMDIAGPAWLDAPENYKGDGGTGAGVRLLYHFLKNYKSWCKKNTKKNKWKNKPLNPS